MQPRFNPQYWWLGWRNLSAHVQTFDQMLPVELLSLQKDADKRNQLFKSIIAEAMPYYQQFAQLAVGHLQGNVQL